MDLSEDEAYGSGKADKMDAGSEKQLDARGKRGGYLKKRVMGAQR